MHCENIYRVRRIIKIKPAPGEFAAVAGILDVAKLFHKISDVSVRHHFFKCLQIIKKLFKLVILADNRGIPRLLLVF